MVGIQIVCPQATFRSCLCINVWPKQKLWFEIVALSVELHILNDLKNCYFYDLDLTGKGHGSLHVLKNKGTKAQNGSSMALL